MHASHVEQSTNSEWQTSPIEPTRLREALAAALAFPGAVAPAPVQASGRPPNMPTKPTKKPR